MQEKYSKPQEDSSGDAEAAAIAAWEEEDSPGRTSYRALKGSQEEGRNNLTKHDVANIIGSMGIQTDDPRLTEHFSKLPENDISEADWVKFIADCPFALRPVTGDLSVKDWSTVIDQVTSIYNDVLNDPEVAGNPGNVAGYIPQLANTPHAEAWGVSICTVDGQRFSVGDVDIPFCVQSSSKPITYCMGVRDHGHEYVHSHVGCEPSGVPFNEIVLNKRLNGGRDAKGLPHNPLVNAGAIMACSMVKPGETVEERINYALKTWGELCGEPGAPFVDEEVYKGESGTAYRNHCLAWLMMEAGAFPDGTSATVMHETLEFYFKCCSISMNAKQLAVVAGSLANCGALFYSLNNHPAQLYCMTIHHH
jgi:glutaminase